MAKQGSDPVVVSYAQHSQVLIEGLWNFFNTKYRVEAVPWGGGLLQAHQLILDIFLAPEKLKRSAKMTIDRHRHLEALLEFLYRGTVTVKRERLEDLMQVAKEMDFQMLVDAIETTVGGQGELCGGLLQLVDVVQPDSDEAESEELLISDAKTCGVHLKRTQKARLGSEPDVESVASQVKGRKRRVTKKMTESHNDPRIKNGENVTASKPDVVSNTDKCRRPVRSGVRSVRKPGASGVTGAKRRRRGAQQVPPGPPRSYKCPSCDYVTPHMRYLDNHATTVHVGEKCFKCPHCDNAYRWSSTMARHVYFTHRPDADTLRFVCEHCGKRCVTRAMLRRHQLSHAPEKLHKCPQCEFSTNVPYNMSKHAMVVHGEGTSRFVCDKCGKRCASRTMLERHDLTHTKEKPHKCPQCDYRSSQKPIVKAHFNAVHGEGRFRCRACGKSLVSRSMLIVHERSHTDEKPFICEHCGHCFSQKQGLTKHVKVVHGLGTSNFTCETCDKPCASKFHLDRHILTHTKERPFQCPHCSHASSQKAALKQHMYIVHGVGPVQLACDVCGKRCQSKTDLARHKQTHV